LADSVYILLGGNEGDRMGYLSKARLYLQIYLGTIKQESRVYESEPWGVKDVQPAYLNQALEIDCYRSKGQLLNVCLAIEQMMGRSRSTRYAPRTIDIDILLVGNLVCSTSLLQIPHPRLHERRFALLPLSDIASEVVHPLLGKTIGTLLEEVEDPLKVSAFSG